VKKVFRCCQVALFAARVGCGFAKLNCRSSCIAPGGMAKKHRRRDTRIVQRYQISLYSTGHNTKSRCKGVSNLVGEFRYFFST
jgi:hypothetical protein